jgi:hypothetical protein
MVPEVQVTVELHSPAEPSSCKTEAVATLPEGLFLPPEHRLWTPADSLFQPVASPAFRLVFTEGPPHYLDSLGTANRVAPV